MKEKIMEQRSEVDIFKEFFPDENLEKIGIGDLPATAAEFFRGRSERFDGQQFLPENFRGFFRVVHPTDDYVSYCAIQRKNFSLTGDFTTDEEIYIFDMDNQGREIGHGEVVYAFSSRQKYFKNKPYVGYTVNMDEFLGKGYGKKRLFLMNALCRAQWGLPLNSDTRIADSARKIWIGLVEKGLAEKYKEGPHDRYRFIK